jgi:RND family efflux transporter MFP subunit
MSLIKKTTRGIWNFIKRHKILTIVVIIILITLAIVFYPKPPKTIATQTTKTAEFVQSVSVSGKIDSTEKADLHFQAGEMISYVGVKVGDVVKKGQLIVSLDQNQLQASLRQATQDFVAAKAASEKYYENHNDTESYDQKIERTSLDAVQNKAYDSMVKIRQDINYSSLYAPFDGVIIRMDGQTPGVNATVATTFSIANPNKIAFLMDVDQADISKISVGQEIELNLDAYPDKTIKANVTRIDFASHTTSSGGNAYTVEAELMDNSNMNYRIGMEGNANVISSRVPNVISVPISSIVDGYVYVLKDNYKFEKRKVVVGIQNDTDSVVESGLSDGEKIVIDPTTVPQDKVVKSGN